MTVELKVPALPESVSDATIVTWHKKAGDAIRRDETLVDLETDKVVLEVPAPSDGVLKEILKQTGETVLGHEVLALIDTVAKAAAAPEKAAPAAAENTQTASADSKPALSPSARRAASEHAVDAHQLSGSGRDGRVTKQDVEAAAIAKETKAAAQSAPDVLDSSEGERPEKRVPMTRLRARIAERLLDAQRSAAILTTFNEVNMKPVMDLRKKYKDIFEKNHGARLGFMSFFAKAAVEALKRFPAVNASLDSNDIVYHGFFDIGVAVSTERGLVVPILRDVDQLSMAAIESGIVSFANKARNNQLSMEEMSGGTFTITNGGIFGSLLSTPILNPPQSAILGLHKIEDRAVVENGEIVIRPMMYLALSYDHRIIDGRESVQFLATIKDMIEDPARLLLEV